MIDELRLLIVDVLGKSRSSAKSEINNHQSAFINPSAPGAKIAD